MRTGLTSTTRKPVGSEDTEAQVTVFGPYRAMISATAAVYIYKTDGGRPDGSSRGGGDGNGKRASSGGKNGKDRSAHR